MLNQLLILMVSTIMNSKLRIFLTSLLAKRKIKRERTFFHSFFIMKINVMSLMKNFILGILVVKSVITCNYPSSQEKKKIH